MSKAKILTMALMLTGVLGSVYGGVTPAAAQHIGLLQSAETMDRGTFKFMVAPIIAFGKNGADNEIGVAARGGYAFTERFDAEAKLGFFENSTIIGADGEIWILGEKGEVGGLDFSLAGGLHYVVAKKGYFDIVGIEVTPMLSFPLNESLELCGALDASFEFIQDAPTGLDDTFTRLYLVPGLEYHLSEIIDLVGEIGIGLNDDTFTYAGAGIEFYFR
jgi:hypothetical protein